MPSGEDEKERDLPASAETPDAPAETLSIESDGTEPGSPSQPQPPRADGPAIVTGQDQFSSEEEKPSPATAEGAPPADAPEPARSEQVSAPIESGPRKILQELDKQAAADQPAGATAPEPVEPPSESSDLVTGSSSTKPVSDLSPTPDAPAAEDLPVPETDPVPGDSAPEVKAGSEAGQDENAEELSSAAAAAGEDGAETEETPDRLISAAMQQLDALIQQIRSR